MSSGQSDTRTRLLGHMLLIGAAFDNSAGVDTQRSSLEVRLADSVTVYFFQPIENRWETLAYL